MDEQSDAMKAQSNSEMHSLDRITFESHEPEYSETRSTLLETLPPSDVVVLEPSLSEPTLTLPVDVSMNHEA